MDATEGVTTSNVNRVLVLENDNNLNKTNISSLQTKTNNNETNFNGHV